MTRHWPSGAFWRTVHDVPSPAGVAVSPLEQLQSVSPAGPEDRLDSWKAIAAYLGRGVRTVQRWEREEGLPVHRLAHEKRGSVYAHREEIDAWWASRRLTLSTAETAEPTQSADASKARTSGPLQRVT